MLAGAEYSGRGEVVSTQFLVVPPELMVRFANNPFAVLRAAMASGSLLVHDRLPKSLAPLSLGGRAAVVDLALLARPAFRVRGRWPRWYTRRWPTSGWQSCLTRADRPSHGRLVQPVAG